MSLVAGPVSKRSKSAGDANTHVSRNLYDGERSVCALVSYAGSDADDAIVGLLKGDGMSDKREGARSCGALSRKRNMTVTTYTRAKTAQNASHVMFRTLRRSRIHKALPPRNTVQGTLGDRSGGHSRRIPAQDQTNTVFRVYQAVSRGD